MVPRDLPVASPEDALRLVRALGKHRYVAGRMHFVHALAAAVLEGELGAWARSVLDDPDVDKASRDERLVHRATDEELASLLGAYWEGAMAGRAADTLLDRIERFGVEVVAPDDEDEVFPLLVDAGWELLALAELDPERHRGAIEAFGERIHYDVAAFEEQEHLPPTVHLQELAAIGVHDLVRPAEELTLWLSGNETYQDYVVRGVLRAAKLA
jgi:hypothetical protein